MKKTLMIDMDDVITIGTFRNQIEDFIGTKIDTTKTGYFLQNALGERKEEFFQKGPLNMYQDAPLLDGAYEAIEKLNHIYNLYIVSAYHIPDAAYQDGNHLKNKIEYLQNKLPFLEERQLIFLNQKNLFYFDIKIDDSIKNLENASQKLLFTAFHNHGVKKEELESLGIQRIDNWQEVLQILLG